MWELNHSEGWALKNWCFWTVVLEETVESPLDCKEIQPVHPKGNQPWIFIGRTDAEAEAPILWPPDAKSIRVIWKDPDARNDGRWEKGTTEDEMVGWHHRLNGHEFGWTLGVGDGQRSLVYCSPWGHKELDTTEQLNWTEPCKLKCRPSTMMNSVKEMSSYSLLVVSLPASLETLSFYYVPLFWNSTFIIRRGSSTHKMCFVSGHLSPSS